MPKVKNQSFELGEFYAAYLFWLNKGAPEGMPFSRGHGLCSSLVQFIRLMDENPYDGYGISLRDELENQFRQAGLSGSFPFNTGPRYYYESCDRRMHTNPKRIAWVKRRANP